MNALIRLHRLSTCCDERLTRWGGSLLALAIRLYVGWQFFKAGLTKLNDWDSTLFLFRDEYSVPVLPPEVAAVAGTFGELVFPALLFVGLFSRPAALGLFAVNAMAVISYPALFQFECPAAINDHLYWGALLLVLVAFGPGRLSLDTLLGRQTDRDAATRS
ncbi:DoxX family protein [Nitrogeniibacter mangrovi]|uniref:DoxX family protein n=1 Tax=Nitrogeniibacter mangrovi TaxID=2016596 RepID=A0A6C1B0W8_9RHOO|nr:DoxX family protein [Nitrogeniibacter mangrovi]QID17242.1 DoxX family protein [Nitrogeniibacter mangrovi]